MKMLPSELNTKSTTVADIIRKIKANYIDKLLMNAFKLP